MKNEPGTTEPETIIRSDGTRKYKVRYQQSDCSVDEQNDSIIVRYWQDSNFGDKKEFKLRVDVFNESFESVVIKATRLLRLNPMDIYRTSIRFGDGITRYNVNFRDTVNPVIKHLDFHDFALIIPNNNTGQTHLYAKFLGKEVHQDEKLDIPAIKVYDVYSNLSHKSFYVNGRMYRKPENGPAVTDDYFKKRGSLIKRLEFFVEKENVIKVKSYAYGASQKHLHKEEFFESNSGYVPNFYGMLHNLNGPALIHYENGKVNKKYYYFHNKIIALPKGITDDLLMSYYQNTELMK